MALRKRIVIDAALEYAIVYLTPPDIAHISKEILDYFSEHGADINLQTTNSGRTIFHEVMSNEVSDFDLIYRMVSLGALINLTDVHGTTPLMDVIKNTENATKIHSDLTLFGKRLLIDAQNCTGETAIWRSLFNGRFVNNTVRSVNEPTEGSPSISIKDLIIKNRTRTVVKLLLFWFEFL